MSHAAFFFSGAEVDEQRIAALLADAVATHKAAITARNKRAPDADGLLRRARDLRVEADALDPEHAAAAWADEQSATPAHMDTHQALMNFYARRGL